MPVGRARGMAVELGSEFDDTPSTFTYATKSPLNMGTIQ